MRAIYIAAATLIVGVVIGLVISEPLFESISALFAAEGPSLIPVDFNPFPDDLYI